MLYFARDARRRDSGRLRRLDCPVDTGHRLGLLSRTRGELAGRVFFLGLFAEGLCAVAGARKRGTRIIFEESPLPWDAFSLKVNGREIRFERKERLAEVKVSRLGFGAEIVPSESRYEEVVIPRTTTDLRDLAQQHISVSVQLLFRGL